MLLIFINMFVRTMLLNFVFIIPNRYANSYGSNSLAAYTIGYNIWIFSAFLLMVIQTLEMRSRKVYREKNNQKLKKLGNVLLKINIKIAIILMTIYTLLYPLMGRVFSKIKLLLKFLKIFFG